MTFDEQLQRALETFTNRLREEVTQQARVVGDELAAAARAEQLRAEELRAEQLQAQQLRAEQLHAEQLRAEQARAQELQAEQLQAKQPQAKQPQVPSEPPPSTGRLAESVRTMSGARSLSEVLDTLVSCAAQEAARAGVLLLRGDRFHGWRFLGFDPSFRSSEPLDIAREYAGVIEQAIQTGTVASEGPDDRDRAPVFAQLPPGRGCVAIPIAVGGQVVAVLYADAGKPATSNLEPGTVNPEPGIVNPEPGTVNPESGTVNLEPGTLSREPLEILALFASQRLEALTAIKAARSLTVQPESPAPGDSADDHAAARRYARLLVSEIKLYHESQVAEGRRERDLATRLGGEIARVRTLYEQRVPPAVREGTDYVHEELIRTLADGDASLLEVKSG